MYYIAIHIPNDKNIEDVDCEKDKKDQYKKAIMYITYIVIM